MTHNLTDALTLRCGIELPNRVLMAPMTTLNAGHDGVSGDELPRYYGLRAGGPGAVIVECAHVDPLGRVFPGGLGLDNDGQIGGLSKIAAAIKAEGSRAILQIFHGGRMCSPGLIGGRQPVAPSAVAAPRPEAVVPRELQPEEIEALIEAFAAAAARAVRAGFDGVEIHGANTYLVQQFFSPHSNRRDDEWGGDRSGRARFPLGVLRAVKEAVPQSGFAVGYRFSPEEIEVPGIRYDDTIQLLEQIAAEGVDYLHFSTKKLMQTSIVDTSDSQTLLEKLIAVRSETLAAVPLIGVGGVMQLDQATGGLTAGFDAIAVGRELIVEPRWVQKVTAGEEIATYVRRDQCEDLAIPESLWNFVEGDMAAEEKRVNAARLGSRVYVPNVYLESFDDLHGVITVKVTVNVGGIEDIKIIGAVEAEEKFSEEDVWQVLPERMIALNSTSVDIITGATMSSKRLIAAVDRALAKASGEADPMIVSEHPEEVTPPPWLGTEPAIAEDQIETVVEADVIVVGAGVAGVTATRSAAEEGAKVVVFEKAAEPQCRSGEYAVINGTLQDAWGRATMDPDEITDRLMKECSYRIKRPIISRWARHCSEVFDWYIAAKPDLYIAPTNRADIPDENAASFLVPLYHPLPPHYDYREEIFPTYPTSVEFLPNQAPVFHANMDKAVAEGDVTAFYGHFVVKLLKEGSRVVGVIARDARTGRYVKALASKGVILASGDYGSNTDMVRYYCPEIIENGLPAVWLNRDVEGKPTNTGDGLKLGAWAGARIQQNHAPMVHHMGGTSGTGGVMGNTPWLFLNSRGERFMNESVPGQQLQNQIEMQPGRLAYQLWDDRWPEQVQYMPASHGTVCYYTEEKPQNNDWDRSYRSRADLDKAVATNQVQKADTLQELFDRLGLPAETAAASVARYNDLARAGHDDDFGKPGKRLFPLERGPFYGVRMGVTGMLVCAGGLATRRPGPADNARNAIPGLYVAGNIQGNRYAVEYPICLKGLSHSLCMFYGYVAGKNCVNGV
ncbi:MAG: FAD-dependent oxidoreductase [Propionibacteriaceae bacterium]|nr:FAD-dependent oxidoreductase [Propionibacteriaceae bacterium]